MRLEGKLGFKSRSLKIREYLTPKAGIGLMLKESIQALFKEYPSGS